MANAFSSQAVTLCPVTKDNFETVAELALHPHQRAFLASNAYSIAQASFHPNYHTRAICIGTEVIGFMMFVALNGDDEQGQYGIWRFMIDQRHQGRGHGRAALSTLIDEILRDPAATKVWISYIPGNAVASRFYESLGFIETDIDDEGEMVALLDLTIPPGAAATTHD